MCFLRGGDKYHERLCAAAEFEQDANRKKITSPHHAKELYVNAAAEYDALLDRPGDAARCYRLGEEFGLAASLFLQLHQWRDAGECYEAAGMFSIASDSFFRGDDFNSVIRCCYAGHLYEKLISLSVQAMQQEKSGVDSSIINECSRRGALYYHKNRSSESMMLMVSYMCTIEDKLNFLRKYDYHEHALALLVEQEKFSEAAEVYLQMGQLITAAECYEKGNNMDASLRCYMHHIRLLAFVHDFEINRDQLKKCGKLLKKLESKVEGHGKFILELDILKYELIPVDKRELEQIKRIMRRAEQLDDWRLRLHSLQLLICKYCTQPDAVLCSIDDLRSHAESYIALIDSVVSAMERVRESGKIYPAFDNVMNQAFEYFNVIMRKSAWGYSIFADYSCEAVRDCFGGNLNSRAITICKLDLKPFCLNAVAHLRTRAVRFRKRLTKHISDTANSAALAESVKVNFYIMQLSENIRHGDQSVYDLAILALNQIVQFVLPERVLWRDISMLMTSRYRPELRTLIDIYYSTQRSYLQPALRINAYAEALLLGTLVGSTSIFSRLEKICKNELEKRRAKSEEVKCDNRLRLVHAFAWEHATADAPLSWSKNPFIYSLYLGTHVLLHEAYNGSVNAIIWQDMYPKYFDSRKDSTLSLSTFLKLCEKYVVWWILIWKGCGNMFMPASMLVDVVCRQSPQYANTINEYTAKPRGVQLPGNHAEVALRKEALSIVKSLFHMIIELIEEMRKEHFEAWVKLENGTPAAKHVLQHPSFSSIQYKLVVIAFSIFGNLNKTMQAQYGPRIVTLLHRSSIFNELNNSLNLKRFATNVDTRNLLFMLKEYVASEGDKLIAIDCRHDMSLSNVARAAKLDLYILEVAGGIVQLCPHNPNNVSIGVTSQEGQSAEHVGIDDDNGNGNNVVEQCGAASIAPPEVCESIPWQNGPVGMELKRVAALYRRRRTHRTPKQWFMKEITREFASAFKLNLCEFAKKLEYCNLCESVWQLRCVHTIIEEFISEFKESNDVALAEAVDYSVDILQPLDQAIRDTSPDRYFAYKEACVASLRLCVMSTKDMLVKTMKTIEAKTSKLEVKRFIEKVRINI